MSVVDDLTGASNYVLQETLGMLADEEYTTAKKLSSTGIVGTNSDIDTETETFMGQLKWEKPLNPTINVASLTDDTDGSYTTTAQNYLKYIKTVRTHGAEKVNMQKVVTQVDGLAKIGRDFATTRSLDEHNAILAVLKGVAMSEALNGCAAGSGATGLGGQTFDNDPEDQKYGFYVDLGANKIVTATTATNAGAARAEGFLNAFGMAYKDYEPAYAYLVVSPKVMASLRSANLVDQDRVVDGNVEFQTIFDGKFRLITTRAKQSFATADLTKLNTGAGVDLVGTETSFIVLPGALAMENLTVPEDVEITRRGAAYKGGGVTDIWYRWGYVVQPAGYDWVGSDSEFASDASYGFVKEDDEDAGLLSAVTSITLDATVGTWGRKATSALSLGILPVFHK